MKAYNKNKKVILRCLGISLSAILLLTSVTVFAGAKATLQGGSIFFENLIETKPESITRIKVKDNQSEDIKQTISVEYIEAGSKIVLAGDKALDGTIVGVLSRHEFLDQGERITKSTLEATIAGDKVYLGTMDLDDITGIAAEQSMGVSFDNENLPGAVLGDEKALYELQLLFTPKNQKPFFYTYYLRLVSANEEKAIDTTSTANTGDSTANTGNTSANTGDTTPNTGDTTANTGDTSANTGNTSANTGNTTANTGDTTANTGDTSANTGDTTVNTADSSANTGDTTVNTADSSANTGNTSANTGNTSANTADNTSKDISIIDKRQIAPLVDNSIDSNTATPAKNSADKNTSASSTSLLSSTKINVNGKAIDCEVYNINNSNYFKLRDFAMALNNTPRSFSVNWMDAQKTININTRAAYKAIGGELVLSEQYIAGGKPYVSDMKSSMLFDNANINLEGYIIKGNSYFKVHDLAELLDVSVNYDEASNTMFFDTNKIYEQ